MSFSLALVAEAHKGVAEARGALHQLESQQDLPGMASCTRRAPVDAGRRHRAKPKGFSLKISRGPACVGRKLANPGDGGRDGRRNAWAPLRQQPASKKPLQNPQKPSPKPPPCDQQPSALGKSGL